MTETVPARELAKHNTAENAWIVIDGDVYDVSKFAMMHPGGEHILYEHAGQDATDVFYGLHRHDVLIKFGDKLRVGRLEGAAPRDESNTILTRADLSIVPFSEPAAFQGFDSPYWTSEHVEYRKRVRAWMDANLREEAEAGEKSGAKPSVELFKKMGEVNLLAGRIGPGEHLKMVGKDVFGIPADDFTYFHEMVLHEEIGRLACPGFIDGLGSGMAIGLPPVLQFGDDEMKAKVGREVLSGEKRICLAITEAFAGSDVANIKTRAELSADGSHYIVNGTKKWITQGHHSDYFVTLVRTGGPGMGGLSFMLIERSEGLETKPIKTSYSPSAGTAYITYENVKVPKANLIGMENGGFMLSMFNFNHERWMIICYIVAGMRGMIDECVRWAHQRMAFGKPLIQQPVIRAHLAKMMASTESVYSWLENLTYRMTVLPYHEQSSKLASTTERFLRTNKFAAILGGSEEVMADAGVRIALSSYPTMKHGMGIAKL